MQIVSVEDGVVAVDDLPNGGVIIYANDRGTLEMLFDAYRVIKVKGADYEYRVACSLNEWALARWRGRKIEDDDADMDEQEYWEEWIDGNNA